MSIFVYKLYNCEKKKLMFLKMSKLFFLYINFLLDHNATLKHFFHVCFNFSLFHWVVLSSYIFSPFTLFLLFPTYHIWLHIAWVGFYLMSIQLIAMITELRDVVTCTPFSPIEVQVLSCQVLWKLLFWVFKFNFTINVNSSNKLIIFFYNSIKTL